MTSSTLVLYGRYSANLEGYRGYDDIHRNQKRIAFIGICCWDMGEKGNDLSLVQWASCQIFSGVQVEIDEIIEYGTGMATNRQPIKDVIDVYVSYPRKYLLDVIDALYDLGYSFDDVFK